MKTCFNKAILWAFLSSFALVSCIGDGDDTLVLEEGSRIESGKDETRIVSSSESATFVRSGFTITVPHGAVPHNDQGKDGKVSFSVTKNENLPAQLPAGTSIIRDANIKAEPMNFTFNSPLTIKIPTQGEDLSKVALLRYNEFTNSWEEVPFSSINDDGTVSVSVIELGYFVLVRKTSENRLGGVRIKKEYLNEDYYYYLTLTPVNGSENEAKRIAFAANGEDLHMANLPLGNYRVTLTRELRKTLGEASSKTEYYTVSGTINVTTTLIKGNGGYETYSGWRDITLSDIYWQTGRPDAWGTVTTTYGTGKFQATLTWVNASASSYTDYDLHLYGPDGLHVFFSNKQEGVFELDRDWIRDVGNATENIYNVNDVIPSGTYTVKVYHYSGTVGKRYNCRVIIDGVVVKSVTGAIDQNKQLDDIYTFTVE